MVKNLLDYFKKSLIDKDVIMRTLQVFKAFKDLSAINVLTIRSFVNQKLERLRIGNLKDSLLSLGFCKIWKMLKGLLKQRLRYIQFKISMNQKMLRNLHILNYVIMLHMLSLQENGDGNGQLIMISDLLQNLKNQLNHIYPN